MKNVLRKFTSTILLVAMLPTMSCMTDREYQLRKEQLAVQKEWQKHSVYDALAIDGPVTIEVKEKGKVVVKAPNQPFREITIPDGVKTQADLIKHLLDVGAISVLGWKAIDKANKGHGHTTNNYTEVTAP